MRKTTGWLETWGGHPVHVLGRRLSHPSVAAPMFQNRWLILSRQTIPFFPTDFPNSKPSDGHNPRLVANSLILSLKSLPLIPVVFFVCLSSCFAIENARVQLALIHRFAGAMEPGIGSYLSDESNSISGFELCVLAYG